VSSLSLEVDEGKETILVNGFWGGAKKGVLPRGRVREAGHRAKSEHRYDKSAIPR
jgi:hypothetical protein